ncbi:MAG: FHA domain-containing protein, partial [Steroidobacteraceae bacterium]
RSSELEAELTTVRGEMEQWAGALRVAQLERNAHQASANATEARTRELEMKVAAQEQELRSLQAAAAGAAERVRKLEAELQVGSDTIGQLESQVRSRSARVDELEWANQQWRETLEGARGTGESGSHRAPREAAQQAAEAEAGPGYMPAPDGTARFLIHTDGGREVVHVLGRKTTIGRTPDNDLQLDARFISRHHAVILAGPAHTIIEDLNSTNGVLVNGKRISRQVLKDGDTLVIGRSQYRFALRRTADRH